MERERDAAVRLGCLYLALWEVGTHYILDLKERPAEHTADEHKRTFAPSLPRLAFETWVMFCSRLTCFLPPAAGSPNLRTGEQPAQPLQRLMGRSVVPNSVRLILLPAPAKNCMQQ